MKKGKGKWLQWGRRRMIKTAPTELMHRWACRRWSWCTGPGACCRSRWSWRSSWGKPSWPPPPPRSPERRRCIRTWAASTWSSSDHRSTPEKRGTRGTRTLPARSRRKWIRPRLERKKIFFSSFFFVFVPWRTRCREPSRCGGGTRPPWREPRRRGGGGRRGSRTSWGPPAATPACSWPCRRWWGESTNRC